RDLGGGGGGEFDVCDLSVALLDLSEIDRLDDVAGRRINSNGTARTLEFGLLQKLHGPVRIEIALLGLDHLIDRPKHVVGHDRYETERTLRGHRLERLGEFP